MCSENRVSYLLFCSEGVYEHYQAPSAQKLQCQVAETRCTGFTFALRRAACQSCCGILASQLFAPFSNWIPSSQIPAVLPPRSHRTVTCSAAFVVIDVGRSQWPRGSKRSYRRFERTRQLHLRRRPVLHTSVQHTLDDGHQMSADKRHLLQIRWEAGNIDT